MNFAFHVETFKLDKCEKKSVSRQCTKLAKLLILFPQRLKPFTAFSIKQNRSKFFYPVTLVINLGDYLTTDEKLFQCVILKSEAFKVARYFQKPIVPQPKKFLDQL